MGSGSLYSSFGSDFFSLLPLHAEPLNNAVKATSPATAASTCNLLE